MQLEFHIADMFNGNRNKIDTTRLNEENKNIINLPSICICCNWDLSRNYILNARIFWNEIVMFVNSNQIWVADLLLVLEMSSFNTQKVSLSHQKRTTGDGVTFTSSGEHALRCHVRTLPGFGWYSQVCGL
jgi:hypothetical protein